MLLDVSVSVRVRERARPYALQGEERPPQADAAALRLFCFLAAAEVKFCGDLVKTICVNDRQERLIAALIYVDRSFHCASVH